MKKLLEFLFLFLFLLFITSCEEVFEEDEDTKVVQYFEGKVDGVLFEGVTVDELCNELTFYYSPEAISDLAPGYMEMGATDCLSSAELKLTFQGVEPGYTGTTSFEVLDFADSFRPIFRTSEGIIYNRLLGGSLSVDHFSGSDKKHVGRLTGSFDMRLVDIDKTDTLHITDGAFSFVIPRKLE